MSRFSKKALYVHELIGFVFCGVGLIALFLTKPPFDSQGKLAHSGFKLHGESWSAIAFGLAWLGMAFARLGGTIDGDRPVSRSEKFALMAPALFMVVSLVAFVTGAPSDPTTYGAVYIQGWHGAGWMMMLVGVALTTLSAAHARTRFFALDAPISADRLVLSWVIILLSMGFVMYLVIPRLPETPLQALPPDPASREKILTMEHHFRIVVGCFLAVASACLAAVPGIRFFRKAG